jgi:hypothetical protein
MATIFRPLAIFIMCPGWIWLQSSDHYQSLFCFYDEYVYNLLTIIRLCSVSRNGMATIFRPLLIFIMCLVLVWLQSPDHF